MYRRFFYEEIDEEINEPGCVKQSCIDDGDRECQSGMYLVFPSAGIS